MFHLSHFMCHLSHVTCHLSLQEQPQQQTIPFVTPPQCTVVGPRIPKTIFFWEIEGSIKNAKKSNCPEICQITNWFFDQRSLIHQEGGFFHVLQGKMNNKKIVRRSLTTFFHYFSPTIRKLYKVCRLYFEKWVLKDVQTVPQKVNRRTHRHTDRQIDL